MADKVSILVDMSVKGRDQVRGAADDLGKLESGAGKTGAGLGKLAGMASVGAVAIAGAAVAVKQLYGVLREGAVLQTTALRFDKLTASIGTTADVMLGQLRTATQGMIADMDLMASASQIISLKLADNSDQVVRLATVAGTLGWDMQQVILTFANLSTMRLDALGLSVDEVKTKAAELEKAGMSASEAFKEAVILAGEARLDVGGVSETEKAFKQLEAAIAESKNELSLMLIELADASGLINGISEAASKMRLARELREAYTQLEAIGQLNALERTSKQMDIAYMSAEEMSEAITIALAQIDNALLYNENAWSGWAAGVSIRAGEAANAAIVASTQIFRAMVGSQQLDWMGGAFGTPSPINPDPGFDNRQRWRVLQEQARARAADARGPFANLGETTSNLGGYSAALDTAAQAELALAAAHARMASAFSAEIGAKIEDGFINAEGLVNMENANKALFEQAQAAGATAGQMALLGVATGQFTAEQAQAALKAAILGEKIKQIAQAVVSGQLSGADAAGALALFSGDLNSGAIANAAGSIEGMAAAAEEFAEGEYKADLQVENRAAMTAINEAAIALGAITGTHYINLVVTGGPAVSPTSTGGGVTNTNTDLETGRSGGASYNVSVVNYINGQATGGNVTNVTVDSMRAAMDRIGVRR